MGVRPNRPTTSQSGHPGDEHDRFSAVAEEDTRRKNRREVPSPPGQPIFAGLQFTHPQSTILHTFNIAGRTTAARPRGDTLMKTMQSIGRVVFAVVIPAAAGLQAASTPPLQPPAPTAPGTSAWSRPQPTLLVAAPGEVEISVRIRPTEHSRELRVFADSGSYCRSTSIGLRGSDSEPLHSFTWRGFPVGDYEVVGVLLDDRGREEVVVQAAMRVVVR